MCACVHCLCVQRALSLEQLLFTLHTLKSDRDEALQEHTRLETQHAKVSAHTWCLLWAPVCVCVRECVWLGATK